MMFRCFTSYKLPDDSDDDVENLYAEAFRETSQMLSGGKAKRTSVQVEAQWSSKRVLTGLMDVIVIASIAQMGIALEWQTNHFAWVAFEVAIAVVFTVEMGMKVVTQGLQYFKDLLNVVDCVVVFATVVDAISLNFIISQSSNTSLSLVKLLRLLRLLRVVKLFRVFPSLRSMASSVIATLKPVAALLVAMGVVAYIFAIPCVVLFGSHDAGYPGFDDNEDRLHADELLSFNNYKFFGTVSRSMMTLFHLSMQTDELVAVMRATSALQSWPPFFFIAYVLLMTLCLFNTIVGVIVDKTVSSVLYDDSHKKKMLRKQVKAIERLASLMFELDVNHDQEITLDELKAGADNPVLQQLLHDIKLPVGFTMEELFGMLDQNGDGLISRDEFIGGLFRSVFSNDSQRECLIRLGQAHLKQSMNRLKDTIILEMRTEIQQLVHQMHADLERHASATHATCNAVLVPAEGSNAFCSLGITKVDERIKSYPDYDPSASIHQGLTSMLHESSTVCNSGCEEHLTNGVHVCHSVAAECISSEYISSTAEPCTEHPVAEHSKGTCLWFCDQESKHEVRVTGGGLAGSRTKHPVRTPRSTEAHPSATSKSVSVVERDSAVTVYV